MSDNELNAIKEVTSDNETLEMQQNIALNDAMQKMSDSVTKNYLSELSECDIVGLDESIRKLDIAMHMRLYKMDKLVYNNDESVVDKMSTVLNGAYTNNASVVAVIDSDGSKTDYYIGVVDKSNSDSAMAGEALKGALCGNFQGSEFTNKTDSEISKLISSFTSNDNSVVASISAIPSLRKKDKDDTKAFTQGIDNVINALSGKKYTTIILADPISPAELDRIEQGYEMLYTQLSPYAKNTITLSENESLSFSHSDAQSISDSINESVTHSNNTTVTSGWSTSESETTTNKSGKTLLNNAGAITAGIGALLLNPVVAGIGAATSLGSMLIPDKSKTKGTTETGSSSESTGTSDTSGSTHTEGTTQTDSTSESTQRGRSLQHTTENKTIQNMLKKIDEHIARIKECRSLGAFNCSAYVLSGDTETNSIVSANFNALMRGENSSMQSSYVNVWTESEHGSDFREITTYLSKFTHPVFVRKEDENEVFPMSAASVITGRELAVQAGLPKKSVNGVTVIQSAAFGRNIYKLANKDNQRKITIGNIYHMGQQEAATVELDLDSLTSHVFVTGSTGSGKSNTVYELINKAIDKNVKFMVVEPAKGEYKDVFGGKHGVSVYGTNPNFTDMLRINPFSFPAEIHIYEHLDRLIEIFNACWPMYAAMPAVLKDAVERAYVNAGWDMQMSVNKCGKRIFPTFADVLNQIDEVMEQSQYSADSKGDYKGALCTRIRSLTTGINRMIFTQNELSDEDLFENNVIVDISRIGSPETKALIMGLLIMKLQEHRTAKRDGSNKELRHLTVLEEAHNLLKRTSTEQSTEGANLLGKSVEMIANAIAEMRTYGEGFIIADQSPGLMDMSVIRNTNTKIILRLPDYSDRELVGKAIGLNEQQIIELSRLPQGVAAISQNDWLEAILCKVNKFKCEEKVYSVKIKPESNTDNIRQELMDWIITKGLYEGDRAAAQKLWKRLECSDLSGAVKYDFADLLNDYYTPERKIKARKLLYDLSDLKQTFDKTACCTDIDEWKVRTKNMLALSDSDYTEGQIDLALEYMLWEHSIHYPEYDNLLKALHESNNVM